MARLLVAGLCATLTFGLAATAAASPEPRQPKKVKVPKPATALKKAYAQLRKKTKSYDVTASIHGGLSNDSSHKIVTTNVRESYDGTVYRSQLMHIPAMKAYRTRTKGVGYFNGVWKDVLTDRTGKRMDRLFAFPEVILERALRHARTAEWLEPKESDEDSEDVSVDDVEAEDLSGDTPKGKTVVVKKGKNSKAETVRMPTTLRVEAPTKEALAHFVEVENSGCFSGG